MRLEASISSATERLEPSISIVTRAPMKSSISTVIAILICSRRLTASPASGSGPAAPASIAQGRNRLSRNS